MSAVFHLDDETEATCDGGVWTSDDATLARYLNARAANVQGYAPDRDEQLALDAVDLMGGTADVDPAPETDDEEGLVY